MRDNNIYSSASMSNYVRWVMTDKLCMNDREVKRYFNLLMDLSKVAFVWNHPMDENRAIDGLELRTDFEYETGDYLDASSGLMPKCTVFEMLAALAIRCENQLMYNASLGNRTSKWFFEMLDNLDLSPNSVVKDDISIKIIEGGAFPLKNSKIHQRNEQIWKQLSSYLAENYFNDGGDLELFR